MGDGSQRGALGSGKAEGEAGRVGGSAMLNPV